MPCIVASDAVRVNVPGYDNELGAKQPPTLAAIDKCLRRHRVCLLLESGKVVAGKSEAEVSVSTKSVIFGVVQTLRTKSRAYCAYATLVPEIGGDMFWAYRTFTPDGGWIGEEINDQSTKPKSSRELYERLAENFQLFQAKMRVLLAQPSFEDGEYGYRKGEEP
jgi:hypothetical protein